MGPFRLSWKNIFLYIIQIVVWIVMLVWFNGYWYSICTPLNPPNVYKETAKDILSDIAYAQALSIGHPSSSPSHVDQYQKSQILQFQKQAAARSKVLLEENSLTLVQKAYVPQLICPTMTRVGSVRDSGYFFCNPWVLGKPGERCIMYSMGINGLIQFERDFYKITNQQCDIFCFDEHDEDLQIFESFQGTYTRATISSETDLGHRRYLVMDLMKKFGHTRLDILKMDIDGGEFAALPTFLRQFNGTVCQIAIEIHASTYIDGQLWSPVFRMLERRGYRLYHREPHIDNSRGFMYNYIHLKCFEKFGLSPQSVLFTYFV